MGNAPSQEALANVPSICGFPWKCIYDPWHSICYHEHNLLKVSLVSSSLSPFLTPVLGRDASGPYPQQAGGGEERPVFAHIQCKHREDYSLRR